MNIFFLDSNPKICAQMHCDKHVVKMCVEYAQILSTAHRLIDGYKIVDTSSGKKVQHWRLLNDSENILYKATHANHPSAVWARQTREQYAWLACMWFHLLKEYTYRYGKEHASGRLLFALVNVPNDIALISGWDDPPPAMPEECAVIDSYGIDSVASYRNYYIKKKSHFAKWSNRDIPKWYQEGLLDLLVQETQAIGLYD